MTTTICEACKGTGSVQWDSLHPERTLLCGACYGSGVLVTPRPMPLSDRILLATTQAMFIVAFAVIAHEFNLPTFSAAFWVAAAAVFVYGVIRRRPDWVAEIEP